MRVNEISSLIPTQFNNDVTKINKEETESVKGFDDFLKDSLDKVNNKIVKADEITQKAIVGKANNVHDVLVAAEEAKLSLELTVQIRNKMVEAYQEINRMQI